MGKKFPLPNVLFRDTAGLELRGLFRGDDAAMTTDPRYPSLDAEDLLPAATPEEQAKAMERKLLQIAEHEDKEAKKALAKRMLKLHLTPRQDRLLRRLKKEWGMSVSELTRRALDEYLDRLLARGDLNDNK